MQESEPTGLDLAQSRAQVLERAQITIDASGLPADWTRGELIDWDPVAAEFSPDWCSTGEGGNRTGRLSLSLNHSPLPDAEAEAAVRAVWDAWEKEGYVVSWVIGPDDVDVERVDLSIRADNATGLVAGFGANEFFVSLDAQSDCSNHPDMDPTPKPPQ